jgi:hypothetical protein
MEAKAHSDVTLTGIMNATKEAAQNAEAADKVNEDVEMK